MTRREEMHRELCRLMEAESINALTAGKRLGLGRSTIYDYLNDPTGERVRARKARKDGRCVDCDGRTVSDGGIPPDRCRRCHRAYEGTIEHRRRLSEGSAGHVWTDADCIATLRRAAHRGYLTFARYARVYDRAPRGSMPSPPTIISRFDRWVDALAAAGLRGGQRIERERISREECARAVADCIAALGHPPTVLEYDEWSRHDASRVSHSLIRVRCGGWIAAIDAARAAEAVAA